MGEEDIDQLQSFGAKITQKNQDIPRKMKVNGKTKKEQDHKTDRLNKTVNRDVGHIKNRFKHFIRRILIKSKAFFSPYLIKLQTHSKHKPEFYQQQYIKRKRLIEKRKRIGNTIIVIRRWKNVSLPINQQHHSNIQHVYYFHQKNQKKKKFQPRKSIWDMPIIFDKK